jgi:hypothetical protein
LELEQLETARGDVIKNAAISARFPAGGGT